MPTPESPRNNFDQALDKWTTEDVCIYAQDILRTLGEISRHPGRTTTSWDSDLVAVRIMGDDGSNKDEDIACSIEISDHSRSDERIIYIVTQCPAEILAVDDESMPIDTDITPERLLDYLSSNSFVAKPEMNRVCERRFQKFAAHMAIEIAAEKADIRLEHLAHLDVLPFTTDERLQAKHRACEKILEQCVKIDGIDHHYTQSYEYVHAELARALRPISTHITTPKSPDTK